MAKVMITVEGPPERPGVLDVRDALGQVLDFFELLSGEKATDVVAWHLISASASNGRLSIEAEAVAANVSPPDREVTQ